VRSREALIEKFAEHDSLTSADNLESIQALKEEDSLSDDGQIGKHTNDEAYRASLKNNPAKQINSSEKKENASSSSQKVGMFSWLARPSSSARKKDTSISNIPNKSANKKHGWGLFGKKPKEQTTGRAEEEDDLQKEKEPGLWCSGQTFFAFMVIYFIILTFIIWFHGCQYLALESSLSYAASAPR
jgi:hypothetical protein